MTDFTPKTCTSLQLVPPPRRALTSVEPLLRPSCSVWARCNRLERDVAQARAALARLHNELRVAQDGERRARDRAAHDELTALPNRRSFRERLEHKLSVNEAAPTPLSVMFLDLDGFKTVNDQHGHAVGDALLRIVASRLTAALRVDDIAGRLGGDEFACLIRDVHDRVALKRLAGKLFDAVSAPVAIGAISLTVTPSIGIATCPDDGTTAELLLRRADLAMYRAKRLRCSHAFFEACTEV